MSNDFRKYNLGEMNSQNFDQRNIDEENSSVKIKGQNFLGDTVKFMLLALLIVIPLRVFIAQPFIVSGSSMVPTFNNGEYLIIDEISYRFNNPERGDVIILKYPDNPSKFFIKRIIGLPGEKINIINGKVSIEKSDGQTEEIEEEYVINKSFDNSSLSLEENEYFVMGDNRPNSLDSRSWGVLPKNLIKGRAFLRLLPVGKIGIFPGQVENN